MEKFFTNKRIWKKIVVAILIIMAFNIFTPIMPVFADDNDDSAQDGDNLVDRGILMRPIMSLFVSIGDGLIYVMHQFIMGSTSTLIEIPVDKEWWENWLNFIDGLYTVMSFFNPLYSFSRNIVHDKISEIKNLLSKTAPGETDIVDGNIAVATFKNSDVPSKINLPIYTYTPEEIFKGNIKLFNIDFFTTSSKPPEKGKIIEKDKDGNVIGERDFYYYEDANGEDIDTDGDGNPDVKGYKTSKDDSADLLRDTVSRWYVAIRNICIVAMLSVLIYIGIRMMLTSIASDKAKYKQMLKDWIVGLCLLFVMHYIMAFSVTLVQKFTEVISTSVDKKGYSYYLYSKDLEKTGRGLSEDQKKVAEEALEKARS